MLWRFARSLSDSISVALEPLMEEVARCPTFSVSETLHFLNNLHHLRLVTPCSYVECNGQGALRFAERVWPVKLESFPLVASTSGENRRYRVGPMGYQSEWCVIYKGSGDSTGHGQNNLYLQEPFDL